MHSSDIQGVFNVFLTALGDAEGGAAFRAIHADDALLRTPLGLQPAAATDRESFASAHRELNLEGQSVLPSFRSGALLSAAVNPHPACAQISGPSPGSRSPRHESSVPSLPPWAYRSTRM